MKVLIIGAHPDDYELGMAGTIINHVNKNDEVHAVIATRGEVIGLGAERKKEALTSAKFLGIKSLTFLKFKDTQVTDGKSTIDAIEEQIKKVKPERIYVHSQEDTHQDHRNLSRATLSAGRRVKQILFYESPSSEIKFTPTYFVDISKHLVKKINCLRLFKSLNKIETRRYLEIKAIEGGAFFRGYQTNVEYAEGFKVFRFLEI